MIFHCILIILSCQIDEEVGGTKAQPTSNVFAYTKKEAVKTAFFLFFGMFYGLKRTTQVHV
jgi:hypothetical protein